MRIKPGIWRSAGLAFWAAILLTPAQGADELKIGTNKLEGTWVVQVTIRDCATGAALRTFPALGTFAAGETLIDTTAAISPALRSPGLGTWGRTGLQTYNAISLALLFDAAGAWTGTQKLIHSIVVNGDQNEYTSKVEIANTAGMVISTGCATAAGRRL